MHLIFLNSFYFFILGMFTKTAIICCSAWTNILSRQIYGKSLSITGSVLNQVLFKNDVTLIWPLSDTPLPLPCTYSLYLTTRGWFYKSWAQGKNHGNSSIHLCPTPVPTFWEAFYWRKCLRRAHNRLWNQSLVSPNGLKNSSIFPEKMVHLNSLGPG